MLEVLICLLTMSLLILANNMRDGSLSQPFTSPTHAMKVLSSLPGWWVVVVADKKTPTNWE